MLVPGFLKAHKEKKKHYKNCFLVLVFIHSARMDMQAVKSAAYHVQFRVTTKSKFSPLLLISERYSCSLALFGAHFCFFPTL
jgi:hypothetical protein